MCSHIINISLIPPCACGEPLDHEAEQDAGKCFNCQAEDAGFGMPEPRIEHLWTSAEIDAFCGVSHRRRA